MLLVGQPQVVVQAVIFRVVDQVVVPELVRIHEGHLHRALCRGSAAIERHVPVEPSHLPRILMRIRCVVHGLDVAVVVLRTEVRLDVDVVALAKISEHLNVLYRIDRQSDLELRLPIDLWVLRHVGACRREVDNVPQQPCTALSGVLLVQPAQFLTLDGRGFGEGAVRLQPSAVHLVKLRVDGLAPADVALRQVPLFLPAQALLRGDALPQEILVGGLSEAPALEGQEAVLDVDHQAADNGVVHDALMHQLEVQQCSAREGRLEHKLLVEVDRLRARRNELDDLAVLHVDAQRCREIGLEGEVASQAQATYVQLVRGHDVDPHEYCLGYPQVFDGRRIVGYLLWRCAQWQCDSVLNRGLLRILHPLAVDVALQDCRSASVHAHGHGLAQVHEARHDVGLVGA
mmetsp:Transcript_83438/g.217289  ORF Transcript_83438/g.217289 Transcript_83438/m.217289 type:complete len:402 (+) Transcript_83438:510-1715(+)